jgi:HD-like signal output (HDOD) protein
MDFEPQELALLEKLRVANIRVPARSQVLDEIENMLMDDASTERMIAQAIWRDVGLTGEVFKLVNSPYYRRGNKIDSLEQAVRVLGRRQMGEVARNALMRQQLGGDDPRLDTFWERCTDIATLCSVLCDHLDRPGKLTPEQAYLAGLFHDCGVPILNQQVPGYGSTQLAPGGDADFLAEDDEHFTSHCIAGVLVAQEWQLPDMLCEAIRSHHYVIPESHPARHALAILQLARHAYAMHQSWQDPQWECHAPRALAELGLDSEGVDAVMQEALFSFEVLH